MTKKEFLENAALRYIGLYGKDIAQVINAAESLTDEVFKVSVKYGGTSNQWWDAALNNVPVSTVLNRIDEDWHKRGYSTKLARVFDSCSIQTVGDLLRFGKSALLRQRDIGVSSLARINETLKELYDIENWL